MPGNDLLFSRGQESQLYISFIYITVRASQAGPLPQSMTGGPLLSLIRLNCLLFAKPRADGFTISLNDVADGVKSQLT